MLTKRMASIARLEKKAFFLKTSVYELERKAQGTLSISYIYIAVTYMVTRDITTTESGLPKSDA